jgi:hypothetical protein
MVLDVGGQLLKERWLQSVSGPNVCFRWRSSPCKGTVRANHGAAARTWDRPRATVECGFEKLNGNEALANFADDAVSDCCICSD